MSKDSQNNNLRRIIERIVNMYMKGNDNCHFSKQAKEAMINLLTERFEQAFVEVVKEAKDERSEVIVERHCKRVFENYEYRNYKVRKQLFGVLSSIILGVALTLFFDEVFKPECSPIALVIYCVFAVISGGILVYSFKKNF